MIERIAFRIILKPGALDMYHARHDAIWTDLVEALHAASVSGNTVHYDPEIDTLLATLVRRSDHTIAAVSDLPVTLHWWASMADLMATNADQSPVNVPLETVFNLP